MTSSPLQPTPAEAEVVSILQDLIRLDSTNYGDGSGDGEAAIAEYVEASLREVGIECERYYTTSGRRAGVYARIAGRNPERPALLAHGHLDVVPAVGDWTHAPFEAEIHDGMVWGRGAVDMKDGNAILLATVRAWAREGFTPERDIAFLFLPDEEAGGKHGAHWLVDNRPEFFEGVSEAVGEVGGFSFDVNEDIRLYMIETAEKGIRWMQLTAQGRAGHGSMLNDNNAVTQLAETVTRIGQHKWPVALTKTNRALVHELSQAHGIDLDPNDVESVVKLLGPLARMVGATFTNTAQPTMLQAGYKHNVIPEHANAFIDGRVLPGFEADFDEQFNALLGPNITRTDLITDIAIETAFDGPTIDLMCQSLREADPKARPVPYLMSGGTDAKAFSRLDIRCYGFIPLQLPANLDFSALFHGVDERVPVDSLKFGARVMDRFLRQA